MNERAVLHFAWRVSRRQRWFYPALVLFGLWLFFVGYQSERILLPRLQSLADQAIFPWLVGLFPAAFTLIAAAVQYFDAGLRSYGETNQFNLSMPLPKAQRVALLVFANVLKSLVLWAAVLLFYSWSCFRLSPALALLVAPALIAAVALGSLAGFGLRAVTVLGRHRAALAALQVIVPALALPALFSVALIALLGTHLPPALLAAAATIATALSATALRRFGTERLGSVYEQALLVGTQDDAVKTPFWAAFLLREARRARNPFGAFLVRSLRCRSRLWFNSVRFVGVLAVTFLFPKSLTFLTRHGFSATEQLSLWLIGLIFLLMIDGAPNPTGSEANRMTTLFAAPLTAAQILHAKLGVYLFAFVSYAVVLAAMLTWQGDLATRVGLIALGQTFPIVLGLSALFVFGSAFDINLSRSLGIGFMAKLHEEAPTTPVALGLVFCAGAWVLSQGFVMHQFDSAAQVAVLWATNLTLAVTCRRLALYQWRRVTR